MIEVDSLVQARGEIKALEWLLDVHKKKCDEYLVEIVRLQSRLSKYEYVSNTIKQFTVTKGGKAL